MAYTQEQLSQMLFDALSTNPGMTYDQVVAAAQPLGVDLKGVEDAYKGAANLAYAKQYGALPDAQQAADALYYLSHNVGNLDQGLKILNNSQEGYNYDTQDIISAYRQSLGRNPTQQEYVAAMADLGLNNFDRASLGTNGQNTTANVAALESDPYAGRYAGYNPYELPDNAVNVSTNTLGDSVQYTNPVTQRPAVASFVNGQLVVKDGKDTMTGADAAAAVGLALATGGLTSKEYSQIQADLKSAKSMDDVYAAFSKPQAVVALEPQFGVQTGVGKTAADAMANGAGVGSLVQQQSNLLGGQMPSNKSISTAAKTADVPYQFDQALYDQVYSATRPATTKDVVTQGNFPSKNVGIQNGVQNYNVPQLQAGDAKLSAFTTDSPDYGGWNDRQVVGASNGQLMGAGSQNYNSNLIRSLRQNSMTPISTNPGVQIVPNQGQQTVDWTPPAGQGTAFNPQVFNNRAATPQEVTDWNSYQAYRVSSVNGSNPYMSLTDWINAGRPGASGTNNNTNTNTNNNTSTSQPGNEGP